VIDMPIESARTLQQQAFDALYEHRFLLHTLVRICIHDRAIPTRPIDDDQWEALWSLESMLGFPNPRTLFIELGPLDQVQIPEPPASQALTGFVRRVKELTIRWNKEQGASLDRLFEMAAEVRALPAADADLRDADLWLAPGGTLPS